MLNVEISAFAFLLFDLAKEQATSNQEITCFHLQSAGMDVAMITTHSNYLSSFVSFYYFLCHLFFRSSQDLFLYILSDVSMNKMSQIFCNGTHCLYICLRLCSRSWGSSPHGHLLAAEWCQHFQGWKLVSLSGLLIIALELHLAETTLPASPLFS